jgi:hypothetical protein
MARKADIRQGEGDVLVWNQFAGKAPEEALPAIYEHTVRFSDACRGWYWKSIRTKRWVSLVSRLMTLALAGFGIAAPLIAAMEGTAEEKLQWSQFAVIALAMAGMVQLTDRVFGWSSGWLRYIATVTAMENLTRQFQLEWAVYFVNLERSAGPGEVRPLFEIAQRFQTQLGELQATETNGWITEFNTGRAMLGDVIKSSREAADKSTAEARTALQLLDQAAALGAIELTFTTTREPAPALRVALDGGHAEVCNGLTWARLKVDPGHHQAVIQAFHGDVVLTEVIRIIEIPAGGVARVTVQL